MVVGAIYAWRLAWIAHQLPRDPVHLLREARRVVRHSLIILQSTQAGAISRRILASREWLQGRGAFQAARTLGVVRGCGSSLRPKTLMDPPRLHKLFADAGWRVSKHEPQHWPLTRVSRDLFVLERM